MAYRLVVGRGPILAGDPSSVGHLAVLLLDDNNNIVNILDAHAWDRVNEKFLAAASGIFEDVQLRFTFSTFDEIHIDASKFFKQEFQIMNTMPENLFISQGVESDESPFLPTSAFTLEAATVFQGSKQAVESFIYQDMTSIADFLNSQDQNYLNAPGFFQNSNTAIRFLLDKLQISAGTGLDIFDLYDSANLIPGSENSFSQFSNLKIEANLDPEYIGFRVSETSADKNTVRAGIGDDIISVGADDDTVYGFFGSDTLDGGDHEPDGGDTLSYEKLNEEDGTAGTAAVFAAVGAALERAES